ncbi:nicotinamide riboside transporter PnuC [Fructilactobacillus sp. Tb1]|uniref:nicotinamide riboside transporter PnuC n=1 Tax=Fructilactobacillus sp. Tb1 TaxID=3422304 RepID=UPI003D2A5A7A
MNRVKDLPHQLGMVFNPKRNFQDLMSMKMTTKLLMLAMLVINLVVFIIQKQFTLIGWIGLFTSLFVVVNLILVDERKITNYAWGILGRIPWLFIALSNHLIGDIASQLFYFIMQFVGLSTWSQKIAKQTNQTKIKPQNMGWKKGLVIIILPIIIYLIVLGCSLRLHGTQVYLDATLLPLGIIGMILMTQGYKSQWFVWILLNVISTYIWFVQLKNMNPAALTMFVLHIIKLINALYGAYLWFFKANE